MLEARTALLEWSVRAGRGELDRDWVESDIRPHGEPFAIVRDGEATRFRYLPMGSMLPAPLVDAVEDAADQGRTSIIPLVQQVIARAQWLTAARALFYTPCSPEPRLLAALVEAYGVDAELHGGDSDVLARLTAHLPAWYPHRGDAHAAHDILERCVDESQDVLLDAPGDPVFRCTHRPDTHGELRIANGVVVSPARGHRPADVVLGWLPADRLPANLFRLLAAHATSHVVPETP